MIQFSGKILGGSPLGAGFSWQRPGAAISALTSFLFDLPLSEAIDRMLFLRLEGGGAVEREVPAHRRRRPSRPGRRWFPAASRIS
jgi:hypothetical protein